MFAILGAFSFYVHTVSTSTRVALTKYHTYLSMCVSVTPYTCIMMEIMKLHKFSAVTDTRVRVSECGDWGMGAFFLNESLLW